MRYRVRVEVFYKAGVFDPEVRTIQARLKSAGYEVDNMSKGTFFEFDVDAQSEKEAKNLGELLADKFFANPVVHAYRVYIVDSLE